MVVMIRAYVRYLLTVLRVSQVGAIIGKGGTIVKNIRDETGGRIRVVDGVPGCDERVIVISSPSLAGGDWNAAQVSKCGLVGPHNCLA